MRDTYGKQKGLTFHPVDERNVERINMMKRIAASADANLDKVRSDLTRDVDPSRGRNGMSAAQVIRFMIVMMINSFSYRRLHSTVDDSLKLREFCLCEYERVPKPSTLEENIKKVGSESVAAVNALIVRYAQNEGLEDGRKSRKDSTAVKADIHHPRDNLLIADCVRVIDRIIQYAKKDRLLWDLEYHSRIRAVKRLAYRIDVAKASDRPALYRKLLPYGHEVYQYGREAVKQLKDVEGTPNAKRKAALAVKELEYYLEPMEKVLSQTHRRVILEQSVPAQDKVVSIFEQHADIIVKGNRETIFGHKVFLNVGASGLVLCGIIEKGNPTDESRYGALLEKHEALFDGAPEASVTDGSFASKANMALAEEKGVVQICFGKETNDEKARRPLLRFRAGVEGIISALKRGVAMKRCSWKGWESFKTYVQAAILAHNVKQVLSLLMERNKKKRPSHATA